MPSMQFRPRLLRLALSSSWCAMFSLAGRFWLNGFQAVIKVALKALCSAKWFLRPALLHDLQGELGFVIHSVVGFYIACCSS